MPKSVLQIDFSEFWESKGLDVSDEDVLGVLVKLKNDDTIDITICQNWIRKYVNKRVRRGPERQAHIDNMNFIFGVWFAELIRERSK